MIENMKAEQLGPEAVEALKESRYIEGIISGLPKKESAIQAGYIGRQAHAPEKLIESSELRAQFQQIAKDEGLTLHRVARKIAEHMEARQNQTLNGKEVTMSDAPDNRVQQKAIDQYTSLIGMQDAAKQAASSSTVTLSISGPAADRLAALLSGE